MFLYRLFYGMEIHLYSRVLPESCIHLKEKETCMNEKRKSGTCLILSAVCSECSVRTDTYSYGVHTESASLRQRNKQ